MLKQEMVSYFIIIGACTHNKDDKNKVKTPEDECRLVHNYTNC